jgi:hypothetical protein
MTGPVPPMLRRAVNDKKVGVSGRHAEVKAAKRMGTAPHVGSGNMEGLKGDYKVGDCLVENKSTVHATFSFRQEHFHKIYQEALEKAKTPALAFQFVNIQGQSEKRDRWVAIPEHLFREIFGE